MAFSRWNTGYSKTISYQLMQREFTTLNEEFWSLLASSSLTVDSFGKSRKELGADKFETKMASSLVGGFKYGRSIDNLSCPAFITIVKNYEAWHKAFALVRLSAVFETFLTSTIGSFINSDPGVLLGLGHRMDGLQWLMKTSPTRGFFVKGSRTSFDQIVKRISKKPIFSNAPWQAPRESIVEKVSKGSWAQRRQALEGLLGSKLKAEIVVNGKVVNVFDQVEMLRVAVNRVRHNRGLDIQMGTLSESSSLEFLAGLKPFNPSIDQIKTFMLAVDRICKQINSTVKGVVIPFEDLCLIYRLDMDGIINISDSNRQPLVESFKGLGLVRETGYLTQALTFYRALRAP